MATAFDHMQPYKRLNYWLRLRISELKEEIRGLSSEYHKCKFCDGTGNPKLRSTV